jgi:hypothetical protein
MLKVWHSSTQFQLLIEGRAIAQAVSRWLLTAAAQIRSQVGFVVYKVALG